MNTTSSTNRGRFGKASSSSNEPGSSFSFGSTKITIEPNEYECSDDDDDNDDDGDGGEETGKADYFTNPFQKNPKK
eukprot:Pgem_evm1s10479